MNGKSNTFSYEFWQEAYLRILGEVQAKWLTQMNLNSTLDTASVAMNGKGAGDTMSYYYHDDYAPQFWVEARIVNEEDTVPHDPIRFDEIGWNLNPAQVIDAMRNLAPDALIHFVVGPGVQ